MDTEVRELFDRLVADPPASSIDPEAAIRAGRLQQARRRQIQVGTAAAAALALAATYSALTGGNQTEPDPLGPIATVAPSDLPDKVEVICSPDAVHVSNDVIRTQSAGVVLVVSSTMRAGAYLSYHSTGSGGSSGGDRLPSRPTTWILRLAPGTVTVGCDLLGDHDDGPTATFRVADPDGIWRGTETLDRLGCGGGGIRDWTSNYFKTAGTDGGAVHAVAEVFAEANPDAARYVVERLAIGYPDDPVQTWLLRKDERPWATVLVSKQGDHYAAGADAFCGPES